MQPNKSNRKKSTKRLTSLEELEAELLGPIGTLKRDRYETDLAREIEEEKSPNNNSNNKGNQ